MNIRVFRPYYKTDASLGLADHVEPQHQPANLFLRARWRLERAHSAISISRLDEDGRVLMLAAKSNRSTDQGTSQALVCNSRLAVCSVAPIKLLECIFDEIR